MPLDLPFLSFLCVLCVVVSGCSSMVLSEGPIRGGKSMGATGGYCVGGAVVVSVLLVATSLVVSTASGSASVVDAGMVDGKDVDDKGGAGDDDADGDSVVDELSVTLNSNGGNGVGSRKIALDSELLTTLYRITRSFSG